MNIHDKIYEHKDLIYELAEDIRRQLDPTIEITDEIITIILTIILMSFPGVKTPKDLNTMVIRHFDKNKKINDLYKISNMRPYKIKVEPPVMSLGDYFLLMKEQLENNRDGPKIISFDSEAFIHKISK
jgi:hypothetical protein